MECGASWRFGPSADLLTTAMGTAPEFAVQSISGTFTPSVPTAESLHNEMRILLCFWLETPLVEFLEKPDVADPFVAAAIRHPRALGAPRRKTDDDDGLHLRTLLDPANPAVLSIPHDELAALFQQVKSFAKRVHRSGKRRADQFGTGGHGTVQFQDAMPFEISQVLYNLAGALALIRCNERIVNLDDTQVRKNLKWALKQPWVDHSLRPIFVDAIAGLRKPRTSSSDR